MKRASQYFRKKKDIRGLGVWEKDYKKSRAAGGAAYNETQNTGPKTEQRNSM